MFCVMCVVCSGQMYNRPNDENKATTCETSNKNIVSKMIKSSKQKTSMLNYDLKYTEDERKHSHICSQSTKCSIKKPTTILPSVYI